MGAFISGGEYLQHVHVASRKRRSMPGEDGDADNYINGVLYWGADNVNSIGSSLSGNQ